ncbi:MAG: hypothetical protein HHAS10_05580 [Candidatus Altimarinota bacterium]
MHPHNTWFQNIARVLLVMFLANTFSPTLQYAFADSTQYYVDAVSGNDGNDGLSPTTAWQTLAKVNGTPLLQGDTVSLLCSASWAESLNLSSLPGSVGLPITINSYGGCPSDTATVEGVNIIGSSYVVISGIDVSDSLPGSIVDIDTSSNITVMNSTISGANATCAAVNSSSGVLIDGNTISNCLGALSVSGSLTTISNNIISSITGDGINVLSSYPVDVSYNTMTNIAESAILYGSDTDVMRNNISTVCTTGSTECAAIRNSSSTIGAVTSSLTENSIRDVGTGIAASENAGVLAQGISGLSVIKNGIQNAQYAVRMVDTSNSSVSQNMLLSSRINTLSLIQNNSGATQNNSFTGNTFIQRAPDYPYIEMRDEVPGAGVVSGFSTFDANSIFPNYKPNASYARTVKFGGEVVEYTKAALNQLDPNITKFEYFGYKPYVNTGTYATSNLITNGDFSVDASNWSVSALTGSAPGISYNAVGSNVGGSATVTPAGGSPDRIWVTNDAILSITSGQVFHVTGYAKSNSGQINLRAFLHSSADKSVVYSDRIAETYASSTGQVFSFYITATTTAADAQLTLETSNNDISYEIDEVTLHRLSTHVKNTNTYEVLAYSNSTGTPATQSCPGGAQCFAYVDGLNATTSWPITIAPYSTTFVLWNNSPNLTTTPACNMNLSSGSVPTGEPVDVSWGSTGSLSNTLYFDTYTGSNVESVGASGSRTFIPPYDAVSTITLSLVNDVGPSSCSVQVTTTNTAPNIYPTSITGSEDAPEIDGTLSGIDLNPGDSVFFEKSSDPIHGVLNIDSSGSIQYYPAAEFCGVDTFTFRASDQLGHYATPISQNIDVDCINDAPIAVNDSGSTSGPMISISVLNNDTDIDNAYSLQTLSIASFTQPMSGSVVQNGDNLEYTPIGSFSGTDTFLYRAQDQSGALSSNTGVVSIRVVLPNVPPQAYNMNPSINEDVVLSSVLSGSDLNGDVLSFTALTLPLSGALSLSSNGSFTYTPTANMNGVDSFDFIVNDGLFDSNTGTVSITINSVLDAPTGVDDSYSLNQDTSISAPVLLNDYDVDSTVFSITGITNPSHGVATLSGTTIYYVPNNGYFGSDSFTYQLEDDTNQVSSVVTVNMNVILTNATPTADSSSFSVNEDTLFSGAVSGSDLEMSTLTYILDSTTSNGTLTLSSTGGIRYTPNLNYNGADSFTFHVNDGVLSSTSATVNITVNPVNDTPTADALSVTAVGNSIVSMGNIYSGSLTGNDIEGSSLTYSSSVLPVHGLLTMTSTGYFTYTPAVGYIGSDSFTFYVNDGTVNSSNATVNINVTSNGVPIPLGSFTLIAPSSVYSGSLFGATVQARDLLGNIMTTYSGSIVFTSTDSGAVLPSSGASISFAPSDAGVKTFSNALSLSTIGSMQIKVQDTVDANASGSVSISVSVAPIVVPTPPSSNVSVGPGGGISAPIGAPWQVILTGSGQNQVLGSTPVSEPETKFAFLGEGSELLNKLIIVNRIIQADGTFTKGNDGSNSVNNDGAITYLVGLDEENLLADDSTLNLRIAFWDHMHRALESSSPDDMYEVARLKLESFSFEESERLSMARETLLRILDSQQRKYHEITDRNITLNSPSENNDTLTVSEDSSEDSLDLSELNLTAEELALLGEL